MTDSKAQGQKVRLRELVLSAFFAAMVTVSILIFRIPTPGQGIIHFGDAMIYLAACFLPKKYAFVAVGVGGAMANILGGIPIWAPATLIIKPLIAIWFTNKGKILTKWHIAALVIAGVVNTGLYYIYGALVIFGFSSAYLVSSLWGGLSQSGGSAIIFVLMAAALDKMQIKKHLGLSTFQGAK